jgi:hypothetical protein
MVNGPGQLTVTLSPSSRPGLGLTPVPGRGPPAAGRVPFAYGLGAAGHRAVMVTGRDDVLPARIVTRDRDAVE